MTELAESNASYRVSCGALSGPWRAAAVLALALSVAAFLLVTPAGALDKVDAVGYAICHRIESHSFTVAGRQLPLCARCTGIFLSATLTLAALVAAGRGRASAMPHTPLLIALLGFMGVMGVDGLNSYFGFFPGILPQAYPPQNWLRLATGSLDGIAMAALILPLFNATVWSAPEPAASVRGFRELGGLVLLAASGAALVLAAASAAPILLVPIALLSTAGVLALLTLVNAAIVVLLLRRENCVTDWRAAAWSLAAGLAATMAMIAVVDVVRFAVTGTWGGLPLLG